MDVAPGRRLGAGHRLEAPPFPVPLAKRGGASGAYLLTASHLATFLARTLCSPSGGELPPPRASPGRVSSPSPSSLSSFFRLPSLPPPFPSPALPAASEGGSGEGRGSQRRISQRSLLAAPVRLLVATPLSPPLPRVSPFPRALPNPGAGEPGQSEGAAPAGTQLIWTARPRARPLRTGWMGREEGAGVSACVNGRECQRHLPRAACRRTLPGPARLAGLWRLLRWLAPAVCPGRQSWRPSAPTPGGPLSQARSRLPRHVPAGRRHRGCCRQALLHHRVPGGQGQPPAGRGAPPTLRPRLPSQRRRRGLRARFPGLRRRALPLRQPRAALPGGRESPAAGRPPAPAGRLAPPALSAPLLRPAAPRPAQLLPLGAPQPLPGAPLPR